LAVLLADAGYSDGRLQDQSIQLHADGSFSTRSLAAVAGGGLPADLLLMSSSMAMVGARS